MNPLISIIVPVYNVENYISICIESILNQTFSNFELILVDDGSKDKSGIICENYSQIDERVHVIHQKNKGLSGARNRGILEAKGQYLCFVDGDDCISNIFCERMYRMMEETNVDFSACQYYKFHNNQDLYNIKNSDEFDYSISNHDYLDKQLSSGFSACAKLYRKEIFDKHKFFEGRIHEDIIWSAELARDLNDGVCCTNEKLYYYRQNDNGIMASSKRKCSPDRVYAGEILINVVKDKFPNLIEKTFKYGVMFPWSYVDGIYVHRTFSENKLFLKELQRILKENRELLKSSNLNLTKIEKYKLMTFSYSIILYGCNAYTRLLRLYLYKIIGKDAYADGHGI